MNTDLIRSLVGLVEAEDQNRKNARSSMSPEAAYDQATFYDAPFVNEFYLLVLFFIWHKVEKKFYILPLYPLSWTIRPSAVMIIAMRWSVWSSYATRRGRRNWKDYFHWANATGFYSTYCVYLQIPTSTIHLTGQANIS